MTADADIQEPRPVVLADGRGMPGHEDEPTRRVFTRMAIGTAVPLVTIIVGGYFASVGLAEREVLANIRMLNEAIAHPLVEPTSDRLLIGDRAALAALDDTVKSHLLPDTPVERVKLWAPDGQIVYSDQACLIGEVFPLGDDQLGVLRSGGSSTDVSDLKADENRLERAEGDARLLEVYTPVPTDSGGGLLFETYVRYDILEQRQHDVLTSFAWIGLLGLGLFAVSQLWLASANLRWLQRERTRLARAAPRPSRSSAGRSPGPARRRRAGPPRRRVPGHRRDGPAAGRRAGRRRRHPAQRRDEHPHQHPQPPVAAHRPVPRRPAHRGAPGGAARPGRPVQARGTEVQLDLPEVLELPEHLEGALYRAAREAVRNAARNGRAGVLSMSVRLTPTRWNWSCGTTAWASTRRSRSRPGTSGCAASPTRPRCSAGCSRSVGTGTGDGAAAGAASMIRVMVVDDHRVVLVGLAGLIDAAEDMEVVGLAPEGEVAAELAVRTQPDVVLMDLSMSVVDGIEATRRILAIRPDSQVLVLTSFSDRERIVDAVRAGAVGSMLEDSEPDELLRGIRAAARGESPLDPRVAREVLRSGPTVPTRPELTDRERAVLRLVAKGLANKQIATRLGIREGTVKAHLSNAFQRIGVADRTSAALWARTHLPQG